MIMRKNGIGCLLTIFLLFTTILSAQQGQFINWKDYSGKVYVQLVDGMLQISPMAANAVRIQYQKSVNRQLPEWIYIDSLSNKAAYQIKDNSNEIRIKLSRMSVIVNKQTGQLTFRDSQGKKIFSENQRKLTPSLVQGENTYCAELHIESPEDEFLFGLGQFQDGYLNVRGLSRRLTQVNTQISIPFVLSNKGYVLIHGRKARILGRICMDQFMVDVTEIPQVHPGDEVTLIGKDGEEEILVEELGELCGRFSYEFICGISKRVPRVYLHTSSKTVGE